jgi:hypothetical protein
VEAIIGSPERAFADGGGVDAAAIPKRSPSRHKLLAESQCLRPFLRMYHLVEPGSKAMLAHDFAKQEGLDWNHPRVQDLQATLARASMNHATIQAFIQREKNMQAVWGITGPEKG